MRTGCTAHAGSASHAARCAGASLVARTQPEQSQCSWTALAGPRMHAGVHACSEANSTCPSRGRLPSHLQPAGCASTPHCAALLWRLRPRVGAFGGPPSENRCVCAVHLRLSKLPSRESQLHSCEGCEGVWEPLWRGRLLPANQAGSHAWP